MTNPIDLIVNNVLTEQWVWPTKAVLRETWYLGVRWIWSLARSISPAGDGMTMSQPDTHWSQTQRGTWFCGQPFLLCDPREQDLFSLGSLSIKVLPVFLYWEEFKKRKVLGRQSRSLLILLHSLKVKIQTITVQSLKTVRSIADQELITEYREDSNSGILNLLDPGLGTLNSAQARNRDILQSNMSGRVIALCSFSNQ